MKKSEAYRKAIDLVSEHCHGEEKIAILEVLVIDLRNAKWWERQEEKEAKQNG